ncbi:acetate and sugar kinases/Hsc70/actin family protein [Marinobacterium jannaschii]|uniref:plasmid segregation protein ParM domain-containing protein n=1 Tax=Marinobacterium jannaschii TaxID=64970 RepID=UPI00048A06A3|nr:plasmid segregation protein ParM domain-containing protein [Marinobacterium jannaschii]
MAIDIGGNTTDMAIVNPDFSIAAKKTIMKGVSHIRDLLADLLEPRLRVRPDYTILDDALKHRQVSAFGGAPEDVSDEVSTACNIILREIIETANDFKKSFPSLRKYIGIGGGFALLKEEVEKNYQSVSCVEKPEYGNADGFLKLLIFTQLDKVYAVVKAER